ncbi:hypothetical protein H0X06_05090 [Candidatus Dependentiae bacterium]|nr:hypothetical protein [Candidatus Dependentiae bacterium]
MNIFFITGTSGAEKTTLVNYLKASLPEALFEVYDVDEKGVPSNACQEWRREITEYWLSRAETNSHHNKSTIICGVTVPSEVVSSLKKPSIPIYFGFIKVDVETIRQRLKKRGWDDQLVQDNINWARYLHKEVKKHQGHCIVDAFYYRSPQEITDVFVKWICNTELIKK